MYTAFNFYDCRPNAWALVIILALSLFPVTGKASGLAACVTSAASINPSYFPVCVHTAGIEETNAAQARGRLGGTSLSRHSSKSDGGSFFYNQNGVNQRPPLLAPFAAMAVSAAIHPELRRA